MFATGTVGVVVEAGLDVVEAVDVEAGVDEEGGGAPFVSDAYHAAMYPWSPAGSCTLIH